MKKQYITPTAEIIAFATEGIMNNISKVKIDSSSSGDAQYSNRVGSGSSLWGENENKNGIWE
ncbi:MAG: hypothetical protein SPK31_04145 [Alloprevotella sp.]|nr:hypothetical protein [Prevotellamassilia sp.]MDY5762273.1 hypothetical protein [Alloprevotella sp.]